MTLTTRTTRKAPWAVVLTALLAVLSLAFGVMAVAGVANAYVGTDKPDDPGNSENAPGHEVTPPGHQDDGTPGNSDGTPGGGNGTDTGKKVWICHADVNNNGDAGLADGTGGEFKKGFNVIYISVNAWENAHFKLHPMDRGPFSTEAEAYATCMPQPKCPVGTDKEGTVLDTPYVTGESPDRCDISDGPKFAAPATYSDTLCRYTVLTSGVTIKTVDLTGYETQGEANLAADNYWTTALKSEALATFLAKPENAAYTMPTMTATGPVCITEEQAAAIDAALAEPATVAPVLPGTIEEPEVVAVPAPATVPPLPATIPAGDGSGTPTVPTYVLALLVLGATALAASTVHLVRTTR